MKCRGMIYICKWLKISLKKIISFKANFYILLVINKTYFLYGNIINLM